MEVFFICVGIVVTALGVAVVVVNLNKQIADMEILTLKKQAKETWEIRLINKIKKINNRELSTYMNTGLLFHKVSGNVNCDYWEQDIKEARSKVKPLYKDSLYKIDVYIYRLVEQEIHDNYPAVHVRCIKSFIVDAMKDYEESLFDFGEKQSSVDQCTKSDWNE